MDNKTMPMEPAGESTTNTEAESRDRQRELVDAAIRNRFNALLNGSSSPGPGPVPNDPARPRVPESTTGPSLTVADAMAARQAEPQAHATAIGNVSESGGAIADRDRSGSWGTESGLYDPARTRVPESTTGRSFTIADAIAARQVEPQAPATVIGDAWESVGALADRERSGSDREQGSGSDSASSAQALQLTMPFAPRDSATALAPGDQGSPIASDDELLQLLQDTCSKMYVGNDRTAAGARMFLTLDEAVPGAGVELVREGAFLTVRLHARNDTAFRLMSSRRDSLHEALGEATNLKVMVDVVRQQDASQHAGA